MKQVPCSACKNAGPDRKFCHECKGVGYIDVFDTPNNCTRQRPSCPILYDPGVHGWECEKCGQSGPII